ncbi:hypothetical protein [Niveibacterium sp. SC-1]|uniref:hypothetical protein n=1 Tax=Niveibacterium sp. SC-1 TaxID=3135646 RepID=UPI00311E409B
MRAKRHPRHRSGTVPAPALSLALSLALAACATTRTDSDWHDPAFAGRSIKGERVLVVCESEVETLRRNCEDQIAGQLRMAGATAVVDPQRGASGTDDAQRQASYRRLAGHNNASLVLQATLLPDSAIANAGPQIGFGIGGFGGSRGGVSGGGVGISMPVGGGRVDTGYAADARLTELAEGKLMWAARVAASPSSQLNVQLGDIARAMVESLRKAGFV